MQTREGGGAGGISPKTESFNQIPKVRKHCLFQCVTKTHPIYFNIQYHCDSEHVLVQINE